MALVSSHNDEQRGLDRKNWTYALHCYGREFALFEMVLRALKSAAKQDGARHWCVRRYGRRRGVNR
jgi:hypothetical protein